MVPPAGDVAAPDSLTLEARGPSSPWKTVKEFVDHTKANPGKINYAHTGAGGLPHLAVIDIMLPGMDGLDLSRRIGEFSDVPIIMLTVVDETETVVDAIERYAEDYVTKPFSQIGRAHV